MKAVLKTSANVLAALVVSPIVLWYRISILLIGESQAFTDCSQVMSLLPGLTGIYLRRAFYWFVFPKVGQDACINFGTVFSHSGASIGKTAYIGVGCMIGDVEIGDDVLIGSHVSIINGNRQHGIDRLDIPVREQSGEYPRVIIGEDTWIGDRAIVMVDVGKHCVIGAGSVVTKPLEDYTIAVGNPARVIGSRKEIADT